MGPYAMILIFLNVEILASFFTLLFHLHQEALNSPSLSAIMVVSSAYLRLLILLSTILFPGCASSSPAFCMESLTFPLRALEGGVGLGQLTRASSSQGSPSLGWTALVYKAYAMWRLHDFLFLYRQSNSLLSLTQIWVMCRRVVGNKTEI